MTAALELHQVRKTYESGDEVVVALDSTDLVIDSDEIIALVGPSGSGKTTLLSIAGGLLAPTSGRVVVSGTDLTGLSSKQLPRSEARTSVSCSRRSTWCRSSLRPRT